MTTIYSRYAYARESYRNHLYFDEFLVIYKHFLFVSFKTNFSLKCTGATYYKWFLCISNSLLMNENLTGFPYVLEKEPKIIKNSL